MSDAKWGIPHSMFTLNENDWEMSPYAWGTSCYVHTWVDTGSRTTWCRKCDADGELDPMTGVVSIVYCNKEKKK